MLNTISSKKAMTLTEVIIVVLLVSVVIGAGITPFILQQSMLKSQMARSNIQDQVSIATAYINKDVFRSSIAAVTSSSGTLDDILTLTINDITGTAAETVVYTRDLVNNRLLRNGQAVASNITVSTYALSGNNLITVTISAVDGAQSITSSTSMALRSTRA